MSIINGNNIISLVRTAYVSDTEQDLVARYNLGAFDTVSSSGGITTITRQTGYYKFTGNENVAVRTYDSNRTICYTDIFSNNLGATESTDIVSNNGYVGGNGYSGDPKQIFLDNQRIYVSVPYVDGTANDFWREFNNKTELQYKTAVSYTEQVIADRPLNTLDQNGSQWLRKEWEKGLNLFNLNTAKFNSVITKTTNGIQFYNSSYSSAATDLGIVKEIFPNIEVGKTYVLSFSYINLYSDSFYLGGSNSSVAFKTPHTFTQAEIDGHIYAYAIGANTGEWFNIMLNEGDHAYPYQPYYGEIVRAGIVKFVFSLDSDNPPATYGDWSLFGEMSTPQGGYIYLWERLDV